MKRIFSILMALMVVFFGLAISAEAFPIGHGGFGGYGDWDGGGHDGYGGWHGGGYNGHNEHTPIPEPATMILLGSGLAGIVAFRRRFSSRR